MKTLKEELVQFVERELAECKKYSRDKQDVLGYRNRAYGAVAFAFCLNALLYKEMCDWWNDEMLEQFNAVLDKFLAS